jgi:hypothetical protein
VQAQHKLQGRRRKRVRQAVLAFARSVLNASNDDASAESQQGCRDGQGKEAAASPQPARSKAKLAVVRPIDQVRTAQALDCSRCFNFETICMKLRVGSDLEYVLGPAVRTLQEL